MFARILTSSALVGGLASPAFAQDSVDLGTLFLSGGLTPIEADAYGRAGSVITGAELEARNIQHLADALRAVPGVSVSRTGSFGGLTQLRLRGHEGNHTLVLIDGIEVAAPNQGEYDFGGLLASDIARIEVLRGPQSSIYGSNAIGGVISITTKRASEEGLTGRVALEFGTDDSWQFEGALRAAGALGDVSLTFVNRETGGFDISETKGGTKDGDNNKTVNLNGRYHLTDAVTLGAVLRYTDRVSDGDKFNFAAPETEDLVTDDPDGRAEVQELFGRLFLEAETGRIDHRLDFTFGNIDRQSYGGGAKSGDNSGTRRKLAYRGSVALDSAGAHLLTLAAEHEKLTYQENDADIVFRPGQLKQREREQQALVLEYRGSFDMGLDLQASLRRDFNSEFKDYTTYALGASRALPNGTTRLHASMGTGVQNPTLVEQFGFFADYVGNPDLKPEESKGWDIGIEQQF